MKFLVALLALPAAFAAPAELAARQANYVQDNVACACVNAAGQVNTAGTCPYGERLGAAGEVTNYCSPTSRGSAPMNRAITDAYCARNSAAFPKASCKTVKQCLRFPGCPQWVNQLDVCGLPAKPKPAPEFC